jgi:hypothetical protein
LQVDNLCAKEAKINAHESGVLERMNRVNIRTCYFHYVKNITYRVPKCRISIEKRPLVIEAVQILKNIVFLPLNSSIRMNAHVGL